MNYEFEHEFWIRTDGSGSLRVTAPAWVWNAVKNVGEARNLDGTVNEESVGALFREPAFQKPRVTTSTRAGNRYLTVSAGFSDINSLVGTRAFPDLAIALRREGARIRLFGVWRRPQFAGTAQGDDSGLMAVRFHIPSEILEQRNASLGVEAGNVLSWRQNLSGGMAGSPIDFGVTMGTSRILSAMLGPAGPFILGGVATGVAALSLFLFFRRGRRGWRRPPGSSGPHAHPAADFLNYDPTSSVR